MQKKVTVTFNRISFQKETDIESIKRILFENPYTDENGVGFTKIDLFEDVLEATLIKRVPTSLMEYDPQSGDFNQRNIFVFDEIPFYVDVENGFMYTFSSASKLNKVKSELRNILKTKIIYGNLVLNPKQVIGDLEINGFECIISEIVIGKFIYNQGAQGRYSARILDPKIGKKLMEDYLDEIQKISLNVVSKIYDDFILTISKNNAFNIKSEEDDLMQILNNLKNQLK